MSTTKFHNNTSNNQGTIPFKLVLVGESGVGKSSIIARYINDTFGTMYPEMGVFLTKVVSINPDFPKIKYEIWDTAGQERYRSITNLYYKDADMIMIVFDLTRKFTFDEIRKYWVKEVINNADSEAMIAIVGNKSDLPSRIDDKEVESYIESIGCIYTKTSAKTNDGVQYLFDRISDKLLRRNIPTAIVEETIEKPLSMIKEDENDIPSSCDMINGTEMKNESQDEMINGKEKIKEELVLDIMKKINTPCESGEFEMNSRKITIETEKDKAEEQAQILFDVSIRDSPRKLSNGIHVDQKDDLKAGLIDEKAIVVPINIKIEPEIYQEKETVDDNNNKDNDYNNNRRTSSFRLDSRTSSFISKKQSNANGKTRKTISVHSHKTQKSKCC